MGSPVYDLVLRWPRSAGELARLDRLGSLPIAKRPHHIDPDDGVVWVAVGAELVAKFRTRGIVGPGKVKLIGGKEVARGYRIQIQPQSVKHLKRAIPMAGLRGGSADPFGHPEGMRYIQRRPRQFVNLASPRHDEPKRLALEVRTADEWLTQTRCSVNENESIRHPIEAKLVSAYAQWRRERTGKDVLVRHQLTTSSGATLLTDAFDTSRRLLIEAKAAVDRPAIRMAIGQLLDYSLWAPKNARLAILVPRMPIDDLLRVARHAQIHVIWQLPDGQFDDTAGGALTA